jgi:ComF family protein
MKRWLGRMLEVVLAGNCALCQRSTSQVFCKDCQRQVEQCQAQKQSWVESVSLGQVLPLPVWAWGVYGGALKRSLAALKYDDRPEVARPLGQWLGKAWLAAGATRTRKGPFPTVIPIPLHPQKYQQRGYNQAELIAEAFCQVTKLPLQRRGLVRARATEAQFGLSAAARVQNLAGVFELGEDLLNARTQPDVLLLDDIYTTGATIQSAMQTLQQASIKTYGVAVVSRTVMHRYFQTKS